MGFYQSIADYYDRIFPLDPVQADLVTSAVPLPYQGKSILDIGCGTGSLAIALAGRGFTVTGIDLDAAMIEHAIRKIGTKENISFHRLDMREIGGRFTASAFDAILCLGNTLVHLAERSDVLAVFRGIKALLAREGRFLLQILNYDAILDRRPPGLPTIENEHLTFERHYRYNDDGSITFHTVLEVKATGAIIANDAALYPVRKAQLEAMLTKSGFTDGRFYGDFRRGPLLAESLPLVVEAK